MKTASAATASSVATERRRMVFIAPLNQHKRFAAKTSRTNKHEINAGVMSIVEREQWNSSKERRAADQSGTYAMLRRAMRALFVARALGVGCNKRSALRHSCRPASAAVGTGSFATRPVALLVARLYCIVACGSRACAAALSFRKPQELGLRKASIKRRGCIGGMGMDKPRLNSGLGSATASHTAGGNLPEH